MSRNFMHNNERRVKSFFSEKMRFNSQKSREACLSVVFNALGEATPDKEVWLTLKAMWPLWKEDDKKFKEWYGNIWLPKRSREIRGMVGTSPRAYLDVGYGDGSITSALCRDWNLRSKSAHGIEVDRNRPAHSCFRQHIIGVHDESWRLPVPPGHFDVITILNTLHHVADCKSVLQNACYYLKDEGQLLVREHDVADKADRDFMTFVDTFFDTVVSGGTSLDAHDVPKYRSAHKWVQMIEEEKFQVARFEQPEADRLFMQTDMLFTKRLDLR